MPLRTKHASFRRVHNLVNCFEIARKRELLLSALEATDLVTPLDGESILRDARPKRILRRDWLK